MKCAHCDYILPNHRPDCRTDLLCRDIWDHVFTTFDAEIEVPGELAGQAAAAAERAVREVIEPLNVLPPSAVPVESEASKAIARMQRSLAIIEGRKPAP